MSMSASSPPAVAAGQEPHNDAAEGHHAADNSLQDAADAADNCHDATAYRGENGLNLQSRPSAALFTIGKEKKRKVRLTQESMPPMVTVVDFAK
ncbi:hypothetical protein E5D57_002038 [Metarhizium anisopliae]|nr:hypothetical protein E5D57_002038 [Metarhizium anisopliae]